MKKTILRSKISNISGYDYSPYLELFKLIEWNKTQRLKEVSLNNSMNYNLIILSTSIIEGITSSILNSIIEFRLSQLKGESIKYRKQDLTRLLQELDNKIQKAFWRELQPIYETVFGKDIKRKIDNEDSELWKAIGKLFQYRNVITHGNIITIEYHPIENSNEVEVIIPNKFKTIYDYLTEKKLIQKDPAGMVYPINDEIANYFIENMRKFIRLLIDTIDSKVERSVARNRLMYLSEMLKEN